ncbi:MAG: GFA family protein [Noviherbaspirillum sp.]
MGKIEGGCLCGSVRYSTEVDPVMTAVCHCKHCQRQSGSAFSPIAAFPKGTLQIDKTHLTVYDDVGDSGMPVKRSFCSKCGSPVYTEVSAMPNLEWIKAGTLDDTAWFQPAVNIWCDSAQSWINMAETSANFARNPPSAQG